MEALGFALKKGVGGWLMPVPLSLTLLVLGIFLWWRGRPPGRWLALAGAGLIFLACWPPAANLLLMPLEQRHAPLSAPVPNAAYVMVMGGSHADSPGLPQGNRLQIASTYRLLEGVLLHRAHPGSQLVLGGGSRSGRPHAEVAADLARALGVEEAALLLLPEPRDTRQEALALAALVGDAPVIVVTSAAHMPRTLYWMRRAGVDAVPAPTDFWARRFARTGLRPGPEALLMSQAAWHEYLGLAWGWLLGGR